MEIKVILFILFISLSNLALAKCEFIFSKVTTNPAKIERTLNRFQKQLNNLGENHISVPKTFYTIDTLLEFMKFIRKEREVVNTLYTRDRNIPKRSKDAWNHEGFIKNNEKYRELDFDDYQMYVHNEYGRILIELNDLFFEQIASTQLSLHDPKPRVISQVKDLLKIYNQKNGNLVLDDFDNFEMIIKSLVFFNDAEIDEILYALTFNTRPTNEKINDLFQRLRSYEDIDQYCCRNKISGCMTCPYNR